MNPTNFLSNHMFYYRDSTSTMKLYSDIIKIYKHQCFNQDLSFFIHYRGEHSIMLCAFYTN